MEISGAAVSGAMKIGVQVASVYKTPMLEVYFQMRNRFEPEVEYDVPVGICGSETKVLKRREQDIFVEFWLVNIGGSRAENIDLSLSGALRRNGHREDFGTLFDVVIPQMAPGQSRFLFRFEFSDLYNYSSDDGRMVGLKSENLTISARYNAGPGVLNWFLSVPYKLLKKKRFNTESKFSPQLVAGDLPPAEYS